MIGWTAEDGDYYDEELAKELVEFVETYYRPLVTEEDEFHLFDWQQEIITRFYCTKNALHKDKFTELILSCPKKQGKSMLLQIISLIEMFWRKVPAPKVFACSTTKENSKSEVYDGLANAIESNDELNAVSKCNLSGPSIEVKYRRALFKANAMHIGGSAGKNISCLICV